MESWPDGAKYEGDWRNGMAEGQGSLNRTKSVDTENILGQTVNNMKENGVTIRCMEKVPLSGKTKRNTKVNSLMISVKATAHSVGLMDANTLASGKLANNTVKAHI